MKNGFTLVEMLMVVLIIGILVAMVAGGFIGINENAAIIVTLDEMKEIKEAIRDRFYPDLGLIPEDTAYGTRATRFICLKRDGGAEQAELWEFLKSHHGTDTANTLINWDRFSQRGWQGHYMEQNSRYEAATAHPPVYFPVLTDAWANNYLIRMNHSQDKNSARIISWGKNGTDDWESGDDIVMYIFGTSPIHFPDGFDPTKWGQ